jgi:hypothetical protein
MRNIEYEGCIWKDCTPTVYMREIKVNFILMFCRTKTSGRGNAVVPSAGHGVLCGRDLLARASVGWLFLLPRERPLLLLEKSPNRFHFNKLCTICSGAHPASYPVSTGGKSGRDEAGHSAHYTRTRVMKQYFHSPCIFVAWCLIKQRKNFTICFYGIHLFSQYILSYFIANTYISSGRNENMYLYGDSQYKMFKSHWAKRMKLEANFYRAGYCNVEALDLYSGSPLCVLANADNISIMPRPLPSKSLLIHNKIRRCIVHIPTAP